MARERKYDFSNILFANEKKEVDTHHVSILSNDQLIIPKVTIENLALGNKLIEFRYDQVKDALGFRIMNQSFPKESWTRAMKMITVDSAAGYGRVSIGRILQAIGKPNKISYKGLELSKYEDNLTGTIYYIRFPRAGDNPKQDEV